MCPCLFKVNPSDTWPSISELYCLWYCVMAVFKVGFKVKECHHICPHGEATLCSLFLHFNGVYKCQSRGLYLCLYIIVLKRTALLDMADNKKRTALLDVADTTYLCVYIIVLKRTALLDVADNKKSMILPDSLQE